MLVVEGNIWAVARESRSSVIIPTNIGWRDSDGHAVMGRGLAMQAKRRYPALPAWYGDLCRRFKGETGVCMYHELILFPVKPLCVPAPWRSWMGPATVSLIARSLSQLVMYSPAEPRNFLLPTVGCGNGGLTLAEVRPLLDKYLGARDDMILVLLPGEDHDG